jgi:hypothetical protein
MDGEVLAVWRGVGVDIGEAFDVLAPPDRDGGSLELKQIRRIWPASETEGRELVQELDRRVGPAEGRIGERPPGEPGDEDLRARLPRDVLGFRCKVAFEEVPVTAEREDAWSPLERANSTPSRT